MNPFAGIELSPLDWFAVIAASILFGAFCAWLLIGGE